jgi:putative spermidine/putrescine transport system permease protein
MSFSMSTVSTPMVRSAPLINRDRVIDWLGIAPFIIFSLLFLIIPTLYLVAGAFLTPEGDLTLKNIGDLFTPSIMSA